MQAIANTELLVADGIINAEQARTIEARAREAMVYLAINTVLCLGIIAATGGLIVWLGTPTSVAIFGLIFMAMGVLVLAHGNELYRMFGNASALIGAGLLLGGASIELIAEHESIAGPVMTGIGFAVLMAAAFLLKVSRKSARMATVAILLMGLAVHLIGIIFLLDREGVLGAPISVFHLYATAVIVAAGWFTNVRLVTALAIIPFAQAQNTVGLYLGTGIAIFLAEPTLSIIQMAVLVIGCIWVADHRPERVARHARVLGVMAFVVANMCALVGSLGGDFVGETIWGPKYPNSVSETDFIAWRAALETFRDTALFISAGLYSILWAVALVGLMLWSAHKCHRGLFNASVTFAGIHAYTQFFQSFSDEPLAYVIGGICAIPLAWGMWRLDHWIRTRRDLAQPSAQTLSGSA